MITSKQKHSWWFTKYLALLTSLFFVQIWPNVAGFTIRLEDILILILLTVLFLWVLAHGKLCYYSSFLNAPLLAWSGVIALATCLTLLLPFSAEVKKDALVNSTRLIFAVSLFYVAYNYPIPVTSKIKVVFYTILGISFVTTSAALLQIAYWDGWLPFSLPSILTEFKEGANTAPGREIFALYIGNTGSHTWSGMVALQAILVWFWSQSSKHKLYRIAGLFYFVLLAVILVRISVRNSILGLFIAVLVMYVITALHSRYAINRLVKPTFVVAGAITGIVMLYIVGTEYYFTLRILQALPQFEDGQIIISRASNIYGRIDYISAAITIFKKYPILGGGFYSFETLSNALTGVVAVHAHNSYFQTLAELGIVGVIILAWLVSAIVLFLVSTHRSLNYNRQNALLWQVTTTYLIFLAYTGMFSNTFWSPAHIGIGMLLLGLLAAAVVEAHVP